MRVHRDPGVAKQAGLLSKLFDGVIRRIPVDVDRLQPNEVDEVPKRRAGHSKMGRERFGVRVNVDDRDRPAISSRYAAYEMIRGSCPSTRSASWPIRVLSSSSLPSTISERST